MKRKQAFIHMICDSVIQIKNVLILMIMFVIMELYIGNIRGYLAEIHGHVNPVLLPFLCENFFFLFLFGIVILYYYSDVPFMLRKEMYVITRMGRKKWCHAQIIGIYIKAALLVICLYMIQLLLLGRYVTFSKDYSDTVKVLVQGVDQVYIQFSREVIGQYTALQLILFHSIVLFFVISLVGMLMYAVALFFGKLQALVIGAAFVVLPIVVSNGLIHRGYYWVVMAWIQCSKIGMIPGGSKPMPEYVLSALLVMHILLVTVIGTYISRVDFKWEDEE